MYPKTFAIWPGRVVSGVVTGSFAQASPLLAWSVAASGYEGKTRLAIRVAAGALDRYADGVWLARLDALTDADLISAAVASVLNIPERPGRPRLESLAAAVAPLRLLLVLDNCEHLIDGCAAIAQGLLENCPYLQILATSREHMNVEGEYVWRVPPLSMPAPRDATGPLS
jgi:predicted ATPase